MLDLFVDYFLQMHARAEYSIHNDEQCILQVGNNLLQILCMPGQSEKCCSPNFRFHNVKLPALRASHPCGKEAQGEGGGQLLHRVAESDDQAAAACVAAEAASAAWRCWLLKMAPLIASLRFFTAGSLIS